MSIRKSWWWWNEARSNTIGVAVISMLTGVGMTKLWVWIWAQVLIPQGILTQILRPIHISSFNTHLHILLYKFDSISLIIKEIYTYAVVC